MSYSISFFRFFRTFINGAGKKRHTYTQQEKNLIDSILEDQKYTLEHVKIRATSLRNSADELVKKIEREGLKGRYSVSHDCIRYSQDVWRGCLRLYEIRKLIEKIDDDT